jgi:hypothetical protein
VLAKCCDVSLVASDDITWRTLWLFELEGNGDQML